MKGVEYQIDSKRIGDMYLLDSINATIYARDTSLTKDESFQLMVKNTK